MCAVIQDRICGYDNPAVTDTATSAAVAEGAQARVDAVYNAHGDSIVVLHVTGLNADTAYGSARACQCVRGDRRRGRVALSAHPGSVIIHAEQTHTGPDNSGTAGAGWPA
jgi:hypothetical protein